ncbi:GIMAP protein [Biomphalaria glabrata]|nr:GIMAP Resistant factor [Biomphalaria glabrata]
MTFSFKTGFWSGQHSKGSGTRMSTLSGTRKTSINVLLVGKTGHGKSATGNSILQRKAFVAKCSTTSVTKAVTTAVSEIGNTCLFVADTAGFADTESENAGGKIATIQLVTDQIKQALVECPSGYDAILYVTRFDIRYTEEEMDSFQTIKKIIGNNNFRRHGILIFTRGDAFDKDEIKMSFRKWCDSQTGNLRKILNCFGRRIILMNNKTTDDIIKAQQLNFLLSEIKKLQYTIQSKKYLMYNFNAVEQGRIQMMVFANKDAIETRVITKIAELSQRLNSVRGTTSQRISSIYAIKNSITSEYQRVQSEDKNTGILGSELNKLAAFYKSADDRDKQVLEEQREEARIRELQERMAIRKRLEQEREELEEARRRQVMMKQKLDRELAQREQRSLELNLKKHEDEQKWKDIEKVVTTGAAVASALLSIFTSEDSDKDTRKRKK